MKTHWLLFPILLAAAFSAPGARAAILIQNGQKIGFLGDSITEQGAAPSGYINLVIMGLKVEGIDAIPISAGVSGNTSGNLRARLEPHVLAKGADWVTVSCGVNDVRLSNDGRGGGLDDFKKNVTDIVERALARKVTVVLLTTTPLGEDLDGPRNAQIAPYNEFLRAFARDRKLVLADVNAAFTNTLKSPLPADFAGDPKKRLLADGTHPNQEGQMLMAKTILFALGVPETDFAKIEKEWIENPRGKSVKLGAGTFALISQNQYNTLERIAKQRHKTVRGIVQELWQDALKDAGADPEKAADAAQSKIGELVDQFIRANSSGPRAP